jgi:maltose O-acetyltransferase
MTTEKEKMLRGELYLASDEELSKERKRARILTRLFNQTDETDIVLMEWDVQLPRRFLVR